MSSASSKKQKISQDNGDGSNNNTNKIYNPEYPSFIHRYDAGYINGFDEANVWSKWRRPKVDWDAIDKSKSFSFQQVATDYIIQPSNEYPESGLSDLHEYIPIIRTFGVNEAGNSVCLYSSGFLPYIYVEADRRRIGKHDVKILHDHLERVMNDTNNYKDKYNANDVNLAKLKKIHQLNTDCVAEILSITKNTKTVYNKRCIHDIEVVYKHTARNFHRKPQPYYKILLTLPQYVPALRSIINQYNQKVWPPLQKFVVTEADLLYDDNEGIDPSSKLDEDDRLLVLGLEVEKDDIVQFKKNNDLLNPNKPAGGLKQSLRYKKLMGDLNKQDCCYLDRLTFEDNIIFEMRFMIDVNLTGSGWIDIDHHQTNVHISHGKGITEDNICTFKNSNKMDTASEDNQEEETSRPMARTQIEVRAHYNKPCTFYHTNQEPEWDKQVALRILSYDIECTTRKGFPEPSQDAVIQIGNVLKLTDSAADEIKYKVIFTRRSCDAIDGTEVYSFSNEADLLKAHAMLIKEMDPDIITGYNTDGFDFPYIFDRSKTLKTNALMDISRSIQSKCYARESRLSSRAWGNNKSFEVDMVGRVAFDCMKWVKRNIKLRSYTLNYVSAEFLNDTKEDVPHTMIPILDNGSSVDRKRLAVYCIKDSYLPIRIMDKKMVYAKELEITRLTGIQWKQVLGNGQSIKTLRNALGFMHNQDFIIPNERGLRAASISDPGVRLEEMKLQRKLDKRGIDDPQDDDDEDDKKKKDKEPGYQGAIVLQPKIGYYVKYYVATLDFASLYPSIMMAHNLCFTTFITKDEARRIYLRIERPRMLDILKGYLELRRIFLDRYNSTLHKDKTIGPFHIPFNKFEELRGLDGYNVFPDITKNQDNYVSIIQERSKMISTVTNLSNLWKQIHQSISVSTNESSLQIKSISTRLGGILSTIDTMYDYSTTPAGHHFVRPHIRRGILPQMLFFILETRSKAKKMMEAATDKAKKLVYELRQLALKLVANSVYGFTGAPHSAMYAEEIAESVTAYGRVMIEMVRDKVLSEFTIANGYDWDADVIYGDTDSIMITALVKAFEKESLRRKDNPLRKIIYEVVTTPSPTNPNPPQLDITQEGCLDDYSGMRGVLKFGIGAAAIVTKLFDGMSPISMAFEKVYWPYLLISKKRYAGMFWTKPEKPDKMDSKGLEVVRRESILFTVITQKQCLKYYLEDKNPKRAVDFARSRIKDLREGKIDMHELIITKHLNHWASDYKTKQPHAELVEVMKQRESGNPYTIGDRVSFVIKAGDIKSKQYELAEDPVYAILNNVPLDYNSYLDRKFIKPLARIFKATFGTMQNAESALMTGDHMLHIVNPPLSKEKGKIGSYFTKITSRCGICSNFCSKENDAFCKDCLLNKQDNINTVVIHTKNEVEQAHNKYREIRQICWTCQGTDVDTPILCTSRECPTFYKRIRLKQEDEKINTKFNKMKLSLSTVVDSTNRANTNSKKGSLDW